MKPMHNPELESYFKKEGPFLQVAKELREILLSFDLREEKKWYQPCYTYKGTNLFIIGQFKSYCVLSFFKGAVLEGFDDLLEKPGENSRIARVIKCTDLSSVLDREEEIRNAIAAMLIAEDKGLSPKKEPLTPKAYPKEILDLLEKDPKFKEAFESLTPGRMRTWAMHIGSAKQEKTRLDRLNKAYPEILKGKGHNEDYQRKKK
ncbi:YdeI/OmpD-associated family protein [Chryseobacterium sp. A301]